MSLELVAALAITILLFSFSNHSGLAQASHNPRLVISEVHPSVINTSATINSNEWIEIYNLERYSVSLDGWTIEDSQAIARLPDVELEPGVAVVIVGSSADIVVPAGQTVVVLDSASIGTGLRNTGDRVALVNPYGVRYDAVSWGTVRSPRAIAPPNPRQSIIRRPTGGQSLSDSLTPWTVSEAINAEPERHRHPRPDTTMRITTAQVDPPVGQPESVTIKNISPEPLLTVNWTLTVNDALIRLRSVRLEPGGSFIVTDPDGRIGGGLSRRGGHLVLRDQHGNWLATASWGNDHTFHRQSSPGPGEAVRFNSLARIHPRIPWFESNNRGNRVMVGATSSRSSQQDTDISRQVERRTPPDFANQESEEVGVWISEVHPTAGQGRNDPAYEWFEISNAADETIQLIGWTIADNTSSDPLDDIVIPPRSSIVVGVSAGADVPLTTAIADGRIGNGLANAGDQLQLINANGAIVSALSWGSDRTHTSVRAPKADESVHLASPGHVVFVAAPSAGEVSRPETTQAPNPVQAEEADTTATPTSNNDVAAVQTAPSSESVADSSEQPLLRITEVLPAPLVGQPEWVELYNPTDQPIDLTGWSLGDAERRTALTGTIPPHARLVISTKPLDLAGSVLVVDRIGNGLNNQADTISLFNPHGQIVHQIRYGDEQLPAPGRGLSIALDPEIWVVTAEATPGSEEVIPLLGDAFRSAFPKPPISGEERLPVVEATQNDGANAWMIVSFALIGVIMTLLVRRWRPELEPADQNPEGVSYSGPADASHTEGDLERKDEKLGE